MAIFEITTADGQKHVGIPMGCGGPLGAGAACQGKEAENAAAARFLKAIANSGSDVKLAPLTMGDVPSEQISSNTKTLNLKGATFSLMAFEDAKDQGIQGQPYN